MGKFEFAGASWRGSHDQSLQGWQTTGILMRRAAREIPLSENEITSTIRTKGRQEVGRVPRCSVPSDDIASSRWFIEEVQVHAGTLRAWLRGSFPVLSDPDNVVQESLTRVWRARQRGEVNSPKSLLFTTARHLALDELRRRKIAPFEPLTETDELSVRDDVDTAADQVARKQELELLTQAIQSLPTRCRQVLTLRKLHGLSQKEIAAQLGISEHTVEAQVANGVRGCAKFLARHGLP